MSRSTALLLCLLGCHVWKAVTKTLREPGAGAQEVTLKVHISDASTHQPIADALIEIFANQVSVASGTSGADGVAFIKFQYKLGNQLIVTAAKHAYVPNSAPWKPIRLPVFSSLSLGLLPERSATLMVYEDVVQIVSGFQGARPQPRVHFQRRALRLPENTSYSDLTAFLTAASSPSEVDSFPYLRGLDGNGTGNSTRYDLTPITAVSVHLLSSNGTPVMVDGPIYVTVPLATQSSLRHNAYVAAWRFDQKLGTWLKSGLGLVHQEGSQLTWTYIAPQLGYWVAAMSPSIPGPVVTQDITTYHTVFLLAILGGMAFILLVLLCLLLYYCRRKCLKPRQHHRKLQLPPALESSKRDQSTSMSHINLLFSRRASDYPGPLSVSSHSRPEAPGTKELMGGVHLEMMSPSGEGDLHTPMLKLSYSTSQEFSSREELLSHKEEDKSQTSFDNLTPSGTLGKDYHKSVEIFPLKARKSMEREGCEPPGNDDYRGSYNAILSQPLFENQDQEGLPSAGSKLTIQEHMYPAPSSPEKEQLLDRRPTECMMSRSVDHLERPTSFPRPGQLICCSSVDQVNDSIYRKVLPALVIPAEVRLSRIIDMSERRTRSGGAAQRSGPRTPFTKSSKRSHRKSGSDLPNIFPEVWPKTPHAAPVRKAIILKKIVAHAVEVPAVHTLRRSPRSPTGKLSAHSKQALKTVMQPAEPKLGEPEAEDSREPIMEPSSEQKLDLQSEPTVTFLFTLLNTPEPKDAESDTETLEHRFLGQEDWGPKRTSEEIQNLQRDCMRLQEALNTNQQDNLVLEERLQNLATTLYENLEDTLLTPKNYSVTQKTAEVSQEEAGVTQEKAGVTQEEAGVTQEKAGVTQEEAGVTREDTKDTREEPLAFGQLKRASAQRYSLEPPIPLPVATPFSEDSVSQEQQSALARPEAREWTPLQEVVPPVSPALSPSNKDPH